MAGAILASGMALSACANEAPKAAKSPDAIAVTYSAIPLSSQNLQQHRVGRLIYRGGLVLDSADRRFGGFSGLVVSADGRRMLSQSDEAHWLRADLIYNKRGNLAGIARAQLADMRNLAGRAMRGKEGDAEGLVAVSAAGPDGTVLVSFEGNHRVWQYDLSRGLDATPHPFPMPAGIKALRFNEGLEGLAMPAPDKVLAVAEDSHDANGDMDAWLVPYPDGAKTNNNYALGVIPHPPYQISDAAMGPDRRFVYLLERHYFGPIRGVVIEVRRIDAATVKPGARIDGEVLAQFSLHENIDNMEGLDVRRGSHGETLLTMISDDNYNHPAQRTLLLMFELAQ